MRRRSSGPYPRRSARVVTAPTLPPVPRHRSPGGRCDRHVRAAAHRPEAAALCSGLVLGCVELCLAGGVGAVLVGLGEARSEEHTSELQSLMRISYAVFCLKKKTNIRIVPQ